MGCDICPSTPSFSAASLLMDLPLPLLEATLATLPLRSVLALSSSSKLLRSLVSSLSFRRLHSLSPPNSSPWFFFYGFNHLLPHKSQAFAFDPSSFSWIRLPIVPPPSHNSSSLCAGINGSLIAFAGARQAQLCIASSPLKQNWQAIEAPMAVGRKNPMVGIFFDDPCNLTMGSIVVAGGIDEDFDDDNQLAVEVYDAGEGQWKRCESMPGVLKGKRLSSAIVGERLYVGDCDGGMVCWLETGEKRWGEGKVEIPSGVIWWQWVGSERAGLLAVALCAGGCVKVYKMEEEGGSKMQEVAEMPAELYELFEEENEKQVVVRSCAGGDNLVYVYSESSFKDYAACVCELGRDGSGSRWYKLPPLPPLRHHFNRVTCLSTAVPLSSCTLSSQS